MNSTWFAIFPCICRLYLHSFPFLISKPNYSFFEGAHFDFQAGRVNSNARLLFTEIWKQAAFESASWILTISYCLKAKQTKFILLKSGDVKQVYTRAKINNFF